MTDNATTAHTAALDARYGRTPTRKRRDRIIVIVVAALFAIVLTTWVVWAGLGGGQASLESKDLAHKVVDDSLVSITWRVSTTPGTDVTCVVQAQNEAHAIVGWKIVEVSASTRFNTEYTETIRTSQHAVTGLIYRCWLA